MVAGAPPLRAWLDVRAIDKSTEGMLAGVRGSAAFLLFLTRDVFYKDDDCLEPREFVIMEVEEALRLGKPLVLVHEQDPRHGGCSFPELLQRTPGHLRARVFKTDAVTYFISSEKHLNATIDHILDKLAPCLDPSHPLSAGSAAPRNTVEQLAMEAELPVGPHDAIANDEMRVFWWKHFRSQEKTAGGIFYNSLMRHMQRNFHVDQIEDLKMTESKLMSRLDRNKDGFVHATEVADSFPNGVDVLLKLKELVMGKFTMSLPSVAENIVGRAAAMEEIVALLRPPPTVATDAPALDEDVDVEVGAAPGPGDGTAVTAVRGSLKKRTPPRVVVVKGTAGTGKSTVALHACYRLANEGTLAGGVWFADLRKADKMRTAVDKIANGLGCHLREGGDEFALYKWINDLGYENVIILLDNAEDTVLHDKTDFYAMIKRLLRECPAVRLLFTTRVQLVLTGTKAKTIQLGPMEPTEAVKLLVELADVDEDAEDELDSLPELARLCGFIPIALCVAASLLGSSTKTAMELVEDICLGSSTGGVIDVLSGEGVDGSIEETMRNAIESLTAELRETLLSIADVIVGSFDLAAAVSVFGRTAKKLLDALCDRSLLEYNRSDRRYVVHTLVRAYAQKVLTEEDRRRSSGGGGDGRGPVCENLAAFAPALSSQSIAADTASSAGITLVKMAINAGRAAFVVHFASLLTRAGKLYDEGYETTALHVFDRERHNFDELVELVMSGALGDGKFDLMDLTSGPTVDLSLPTTAERVLPHPLDARAAVIRAFGAWGVIDLLKCRMPLLIGELYMAAEALWDADDKDLALLALQSANHFGTEKSDENAVRARFQAAHDRVSAHFDKNSREYIQSTISLQKSILAAVTFTKNVGASHGWCWAVIGVTGTPKNRRSRRCSMLYNKDGPSDYALMLMCCSFPPDQCSGEPCKSSLPLIPEWETARDIFVDACDEALNSTTVYFPLPSKIAIRLAGVDIRYSSLQRHYEALKEARLVFALANRGFGRDHLITIDAADMLRTALINRGRLLAASEVEPSCDTLCTKLGDAHPSVADALVKGILGDAKSFNEMNFLSTTLSVFNSRRQILKAIKIYSNAENIDDGRLADAYKALAEVWGQSLGLIGLLAVFPAASCFRKACGLYRSSGSSKYKGCKKDAWVLTLMSFVLPPLYAAYILCFSLILSDVLPWVPAVLIWIVAFMLPFAVLAFVQLFMMMPLLYTIEACCGCALMDTRTLRQEVPEYFEAHESIELKQTVAAKPRSSSLRSNNREWLMKVSLLTAYLLASSPLFVFVYLLATY
jgi:RecA/RadA recombinase